MKPRGSGDSSRGGKRADGGKSSGGKSGSGSAGKRSPKRAAGTSSPKRGDNILDRSPRSGGTSGPKRDAGSGKRGSSDAPSRGGKRKSGSGDTPRGAGSTTRAARGAAGSRGSGAGKRPGPVGERPARGAGSGPSGKPAGKTSGGPRGAWNRKDLTLTDPGAHVFRVGPEHGTDLGHFLAMSIPGKLSVRAIRRLLEEGRCRVNGKVDTYGSRKLYRNDIVSFVAPTREERGQRFAYEAGRVLYDEHDLVAYDKPPGLPVTPTDAATGPSLIGVLRREMGDLLACHRLDADTSGVVLLARTREVQQRYEAAFRDHAVKKRYLALVRGRPPKGGTQKSGLILVDQGAGFERWASGKGQGALLAITRWVAKTPIGRHACLVEVEPRTGRTHQIRVHLAELGYPLFGDKIYGDRKDPIHVSRHLLHAEQLTAPHPLEAEQTIKLQAPRPADFEAAIRQLEQLK